MFYQSIIVTIYRCRTIIIFNIIKYHFYIQEHIFCIIACKTAQRRRKMKVLLVYVAKIGVSKTLFLVFFTKIWKIAFFSCILRYLGVECNSNQRIIALNCYRRLYVHSVIIRSVIMSYVQNVIDMVAKKHANEPEFVQTVTEVFDFCHK